MANKKFSLGILVMVLVFGMTVIGCDFLTEDPHWNVTTFASGFNMPVAGISIDSRNNLYVSEWSANRVRRIDSAGNITTIASTGFRQPSGTAVDNAGNVYVVDNGNHRIRRIDVGGNVTTIAGDGTAGFADDQGAFARFNGPRSLVIDSAGNLYVTDSGNNRIRRIDTMGNVTTIAGGTGGFVDGHGSSARFNFPVGITIDSAGNLYVTDEGNQRIRRIDTARNVTTIAGDGTAGFADGRGTSARFNVPSSIVVDNLGNLYVTDWEGHRIRRIDTAGNVTTIAGTGVRGFADGRGAEAKFSLPNGITINSAGDLFVADSFNGRIRRIRFVE